MEQPNDPLSIEELAKRLEAIEKDIGPLKKDNLQLKKENIHLKRENEKIKKEIENIRLQLSQMQQITNNQAVDDQIYTQEYENAAATKRSPQPEKTRSYNNFNSLPLKTQQSVISEIISNSPNQENRSFRKLNNLLLYLLRFNKSLEAVRYIEIPTKNIDDLFENIKEGDQELKGIHVLSNAVEILYFNESLNSPDFINLLTEFDDLLIELKYPSDSFKKTYEIITTIKSTRISKMKIQILITGIKETDDTFKSNRNIYSIKIDSSVKSIGKNSFYYCSSLSRVSISSSVVSIGDHSFYGCSSLTQVAIPSSVTSIDKYAFCGCSSLIRISIPSSVTSIGNFVFEKCASIREITIPSSVTSLGGFVFSGCSSLRQVTIPTSIKVINKFSFSGCSSLTQISIPSSVISIGEHAFERCSKLSEVEIPNSVTSIGNYAFAECVQLSQISIPSSVTSIGRDAIPSSTQMIKL